jgi:putative endonuclease
MIPSRTQKPEVTWFVYIVQCRDGSLYTGITTDLERRVREHNSSDVRGARYVKTRRPARLVYWEMQPGRGAAMKREVEIKKYPRDRKLKLIKNPVF